MPRYSVSIDKRRRSGYNGYKDRSAFKRNGYSHLPHFWIIASTSFTSQRITAHIKSSPEAVGQDSFGAELFYP